MLRWIRKRLALRSYRRKLGPALVARYGRERHYTVHQVRATADKLGLATAYLCFAYADYCSHYDFDAHHRSTGEACDWAEMRHELASSWGVGHHHDFGANHGFGEHHADGDHDGHGHHGHDHGGHDAGGDHH